MGKKIDVIFQATASDGKMVYKNPAHVEAYCRQFEGKDFSVSYRQSSTYSEKSRLWAYLFGCLIDCVVQALTDDGWQAVDESTAYGYIKMRVGRRVAINEKTGQEMHTDIDFSRESADRLHKLVVDTIHILQHDHNFHNIPDADEYKLRKKDKG